MPPSVLQIKLTPVITYWKKGCPVNERQRKPCENMHVAIKALKALRKRGYHARLAFVTTYTI